MHKRKVVRALSYQHTLEIEVAYLHTLCSGTEHNAQALGSPCFVVSYQHTLEIEVLIL